jgi:hypothetical protein
MSRNGSGTYSLPAGNPVVTGTIISSTWANNTLSDIGTALTQSIAVDGQSPITANIPFNNHKATGLAAGTASGDAIMYGQSGTSLAGLTLTGALNIAQEVDVASAATTDIGGATSSQIRITGNTTITSFGTTYSGPRYIRSAASFQITASATLVTPGGVNFITAINDTFVALPLPSGAGWIIVSYTRAASNGVIRGQIFGLTLSTTGSSATMSIAAGQAADSTNAQYMTLAAIAKTTSAWAVGTGNGGLDTGAIANSTWYFFYVIERPDTGVVDVVFSANSTTPTLPTNYTLYRRIGAGRTNGSAQWTSFTQDGDYFEWASPVLDVTATTPGSAAVTRTLTVPTGINVRAIMNVLLDGTTSGDAVYLSDLAVTDIAPSTTVAPLAQVYVASSLNGVGQVVTRTNTSGQIRSRMLVGAGSNALRIATTGWYDRRGQDA